MCFPSITNHVTCLWLLSLQVCEHVGVSIYIYVMIFSVGMSERTSCLHCIKQFSVSAFLSCIWLMCKIGLFLLPYIPEAGDLSGFRFSSPPEAHKAFHVLVGWSQTEYYTWRRTLQVAIDWSSPFCLFSVLCVFFLSRASVCVVASAKLAVCDELLQHWRQIWTSRGVGFAQKL